MLTSRGQVVDGSSGINFLKQRVKAMRAWWFYAANTRQRTTPAKQNIKVHLHSVKVAKINQLRMVLRRLNQILNLSYQCTKYIQT